MADQDPEAPIPLRLSDDEKRVLELHDRLQQLQLEIAIITAQKNYVPDPDSERSRDAAEKQVLESRALYVLRNDKVEGAMIARPILQAAHNGTRASPVERDLLPHLHARDKTTTALAQQASAHRALQDALFATEASNQRLARENVHLATQMLALAEQTAHPGGEASALDPDSELRAEMAALEDEVRAGRRKWRVLKGTASAVVAGSGVDWARDAELRGMVMDGEGDGI
ncbi:Uu.00g012510.m01.CDS01 [Anthostomella pinea]|uniref:Uu.00g012510.m01.CDS01 n=1 Tax=Anthostomella pinea TaxID=933095 RepID=A0AAI8VXZ4_9PEZI|nr:Uu.00g012510.m01.CDS01 [Anthostomella pinea]